VGEQWKQGGKIVGRKQQDFGLNRGSKSEPGKNCCCPLLSKLWECRAGCWAFTTTSSCGTICWKWKNRVEWIGKRWLICQHRVYCGKVALWRGTSARELKPTAAYRLEVDNGGG
jgi:hypothetical protein